MSDLTPDDVLRLITDDAHGYSPNAELARQLLEAREALRFYADADRWLEYRRDSMAAAFDRDFGSELGDDDGACARACLPEYEEKSDE